MGLPEVELEDIEDILYSSIHHSDENNGDHFALIQSRVDLHMPKKVRYYQHSTEKHFNKNSKCARPSERRKTKIHLSNRNVRNSHDSKEVSNNTVMKKYGHTKCEGPEESNIVIVLSDSDSEENANALTSESTLSVVDYDTENGLVIKRGASFEISDNTVDDVIYVENPVEVITIIDDGINKIEQIKEQSTAEQLIEIEQPMPHLDSEASKFACLNDSDEFMTNSELRSTQGNLSLDLHGHEYCGIEIRNSMQRNSSFETESISSATDTSSINLFKMSVFNEIDFPKSDAAQHITTNNLSALIGSTMTNAEHQHDSLMNTSADTVTITPATLMSESRAGDLTSSIFMSGGRFNLLPTLCPLSASNKRSKSVIEQKKRPGVKTVGNNATGIRLEKKTSQPVMDTERFQSDTMNVPLNHSIPTQYEDQPIRTQSSASHRTNTEDMTQQSESQPVTVPKTWISSPECDGKERNLSSCNAWQIQNTMTDDPSLWDVLDADRGGARKSTKHCKICKQIGHILFNCPNKYRRILKCCLCAETGHVEPQCPNKICANCGRSSQRFTIYCRHCTRFRDFVCQMCSMLGHSSSSCPDLWRRYHLTTDRGPLMKPQEMNMKPIAELWCSACAQPGHLEFSCRYFQPSYPPTVPYIKCYQSLYCPDGTEVRNMNYDNVKQTANSHPDSGSLNVEKLFLQLCPMERKCSAISFDQGSKDTALSNRLSRDFVKKSNKFDIFMSSPVNVIQSFIGRELTRLAKFKLEVDHWTRIYRRNIDTKSECNYRMLNMILFGIYFNGDGRNHLNTLKTFKRHLNCKKNVAFSRRSSLYKAYSYIFGIEPHSDVNYVELLKKL